MTDTTPRRPTREDLGAAPGLRRVRTRPASTRSSKRTWLPAMTLIWYNLNQSNYYGVDHIVELWKMLAAVSQGREAICETARRARSPWSATCRS